MAWLLLTAAVAPVAFMLHFVYVRDKYEREPLARVLLVFFLSFLTVIPAAIVESFFGFFETRGLRGIALSAWGVIAFSEEGFKYLAVKLIAVRHPSFNEVYDGILYAVAASLGFAAVENILYVFFAGDQGLMVAVLRALLSVPAHALWGVMMGYYIGRAKFEPDQSKKRGWVLRGVGLAIFWHGLYDFFAFGVDVVGENLTLVFGLGVLLVVILNWIIGVQLIRDAQRRSVFKRPSVMVNPLAAVNPRVKYCHRCGMGQRADHRFCVRCGYGFPR